MFIMFLIWEQVFLQQKAASFVHLLRETQKQDLSNLNGIMTRARGALNGQEYEKMHQLWQNEK